MSIWLEMKLKMWLVPLNAQILPLPDLIRSSVLTNFLLKQNKKEEETQV